MDVQTLCTDLSFDGCNLLVIMKSSLSTYSFLFFKSYVMKKFFSHDLLEALLFDLSHLGLTTRHLESVCVCACVHCERMVKIHVFP